MTAPIIPGLNDSEIPAILTAAREAVPKHAGYVTAQAGNNRATRLPRLARAQLSRQGRPSPNPNPSDRGGQLNDSQFGRRQVGTGNMAE